MVIYVSFENQIHLIFDKFWWLIKRLTRKFIRIVKHTKSQILFTSLTAKTFFIDILKYINHNYDKSSPWGCKMGQNIARIAKQSWSLKVFCSNLETRRHKKPLNSKTVFDHLIGSYSCNLEKRVKFWPFHLFWSKSLKHVQQHLRQFDMGYFRI